METRIMQATNGGSISVRPLTTPSGSVGGGTGARAEGAAELGDPQVHEIEIRVDARLAAHVGRDDDRLGPGALRHVLYLAAIIVVGGEQHRDVLLLHPDDYLLHVPRGRRNARLRLDVVEAGHLEF